MNKIRIGIIGLGGIAKAAHIPAYVTEDRVEIVALCDVIESRALEAKKKFFKDAAVYTDYSKMIAEAEIDAVDICTPNYLHSQIAVEALNAGLHVFCEKPDAISVEEAQKMYSAAAANEKLLMVMRNNRFNPHAAYLKHFIDDGKMGTVYAGRCGWIRRRGIPGKGGWFTTKELSGGGPLIDLGVHILDLTSYLIGDPKPVAVTCCAYKAFGDNTSPSDTKNAEFGYRVVGGINDVEDMVIGSIRYENGAMIQYEFSWASNVEKESSFIELRGTEAGAKWTTDRVELYYEEKKKQKTKSIVNNSLVGDHAMNLKNFVDVLVGETNPCYFPSQGLEIMTLIEALYASAKLSGKEIEL